MTRVRLEREEKFNEWHLKIVVEVEDDEKGSEYAEEAAQRLLKMEWVAALGHTEEKP